LIVDTACLGFAGWTVVCNIAVFLGANTHQLAIATAAALLVALSVLGYLSWRYGVRSLADSLGDATDKDEPTPASSTDLSTAARAAGVVAAVVVVSAFYYRRDFTVLWACASLYFAVACWMGARSSPERHSPLRSIPAEALLWAVALLAMFLTLASRKYDVDDSFYINMGVAAADFPARPLLRFDTLHGTGLPFHAPYYKVHTFELLGGLISYAFGIETIRVIHIYLTGFAAFLTPFALARLFRLLDPRRWIWAVCVVVAFYVFADGPHRGYTSFAFLRLFQGKAVFVTVAAPLIAAYGIRLALCPRPRNALFLAAAQIAGLGLTSTAIWLAPLIGLASVASALPLRFRSCKPLLYGLLSCSYLLLTGIVLLLEVKSVSAKSAVAGLASVDASGDAAWKLSRKAVGLVLGSPRDAARSFAFVLLAWPLCRTALARRFVALFGLVFFLFLLNPWSAGVIRSFIGTGTFWRVLWFLPVPVMTALCFTSLISARPGTVRAKIEAGLVAALVVIYFAIHPPRKRIAVGPPVLKVPSEYVVAEALNRNLPPGSYALAPRMISLYLPTFNHYAYPILTKRKYLKTGKLDRKRRARLVKYINGTRYRRNGRRFLEQLNRYRISGVAIRAKHRRKYVREMARDTGKTLKTAGFRLVDTVRGYQIWIRKLNPLPSTARTVP